MIAAATRFVSRGIVQFVLAVIAFLWLVPAVGLLFASGRSAADSNQSGWWTAITEPSQLTLDNYRNLLDDSTMVDAFWNTVLITVPAVILVIVLAALAAYAFAWIDFPGRDVLFLIVVGLLVVPIQVALIPVARLFGDLGIYGDRLGVIAFHVAFGLPFAVSCSATSSPASRATCSKLPAWTAHPSSPSSYEWSSHSACQRWRRSRSSSSSGCGTTCSWRWCSRRPTASR